MASAPWAPPWLPTGAFGAAAQQVVDAATEYVFWLCATNGLPIDECTLAELHNFAPSLEWLACASRKDDAEAALENFAAELLVCANEQRQCECPVVECFVTVPDVADCPDYQSNLCPNGETFGYRCDQADSLNCSDGYDERNCDRLAPRYDCGDGGFIAWTAVCDGVGDCANAVDEFSCGATAQPTEPYAPRSGSFKVLVYSRTLGYRGSSIPYGQQMLSALAADYGFELTLTEDHGSFTPEKLAEYELVFFLNTSGDVLNDAEQVAFESWMVEKNGAFAGTNRAADTEYDWSFYKELTGEYYDGHESCCPEQDIVWEPSALDFPAVRDLPSPWRLGELWFHFDEFSTWRTKPGFRVLATIEIEGETQPVSFVREWGNFRSFYTVLGHVSTSFEDANVRRHIAAGILWTVRREHWLD